MKTLTSLVIAGIASTVFAADFSKASPSGKCRNNGRVPSELAQYLSANGIEVTEKKEAVQCSASTTTKFVVWKTEENDDEDCGSTHTFSEELGPCCGGFEPENYRSITAATNFAPGRAIASVQFEINLTQEPQECCEGCRCWGDPHCAKFGAETSLDDPIARQEGIKSFLACDTAVYNEKDGTCSNRVQRDDAARSRCLGETPGYEHNGNGNCKWRPDENPGYSLKEHGGPCVPTQNVRMHMFGHTLAPGTEVQSAEGKTQSLEGRYDVFSQVGERGVIETVEIEIKLKGQKMKKLQLRGKSDSLYPYDQDNKALVASVNTARLGIFQAFQFQFVRTLQIADSSVDMLWTITDTNTKEQIEVLCRGGMDALSRSDNYATFQELLTEQAQAEVSANGFSDLSAITYQQTELAVATADKVVSQSSRSAKSSYIDTQIYVSKFPRGVTDLSGYCYTGEFDYESHSNYFGPLTQKLQTCSAAKNLDLEDRQIIASMPDCVSLIEENGCDGFVDDKERIDGSKAYKKNLREYLQIIDKCITVYCQKAYIPSGFTELECITEFYDFGALSAMETFVPKTQDSSTVSSAPVTQPDCVPEIKITYEYVDEEGEDKVCTKVWEEEDFDYEQAMTFRCDETGEPKRITVEQNDCAGICGTRPMLAFDVKFNTVCRSNESGAYECYKQDASPETKDKCVEECFDVYPVQS